MRQGSQQPTFERVGPYVRSSGMKLASVWRAWGTRFYPSQVHELELFTARDGDGRFASKSIGISKPRQNGKSFAARKYAITMAAKGKKVLYSAHNGSTVRQMFKYIKDDIEGNRKLMGRLKPRDGIYKAAGSEGVYFANGGCIEFQTRTTSGARGRTYDVIIIDEAQELTYDQFDAIKPTMLASDSGDPQMIYLGTPPSPACNGTVFRDMHDAAHDGKSDAWWLEWAVDEVPDMGNKSQVLTLAYATNPAMGRRIREDVMLDAIANYVNKPDSFAREYLGWWSPVRAVADEHVFDPEAWDACATDDEPAGDICYGVKLSPDGSEAALSACWKSDRPHLELVDYRDTRRGLGWLAEWLDARADKCAMLAVDGRNAEALTSRLENYRDRQLHVMNTRDAIDAAALLVDGIRSGTVTHYGQAELDEQAKAATRRKVGRDAWCIGGEPSTAIESAADALWAAKNAKYKPGRKARIG